MAGKRRRALREVIDIQKRVKSTNSTTGQVIVTYETEFTSVRADFDQTMLEEKEHAGGQIRAHSKSVFVIRYLPGVTNTHRVVHNGVAFGITGVKWFQEEHEGGVKYLTLQVESESC